MVSGWSRVTQDRYRVDRELGHRGHISSWLVTDLKTVSPCVLRCLREADATAAEASLFEARARILAGLDHPGLPRFVEYFVAGEGAAREHVLITRYHAGESLDRLVAKGRLFGEAQAVALLRRLVPVFAYLHGCDPPLVHRSLKPANLIIGPDGRPCLTDLNFAVAGEGWKAWEDASPDAAGFSFAAPEVALGGAVPASDIHALGLLLIYAMSGQEPAAIAREGGRQRIRDATRSGESFAAILARMVETSLERRYAEADALQADLARLAAGGVPAAIPAPPPSKAISASSPVVIAPPAPGVPGERPKRNVVRLAALLVILAAVGAVLVISRLRRAGAPGESLLPPPEPAVHTYDTAPAQTPSPAPAAPAPAGVPAAPPAQPEPPARPEGEAGSPAALPPSPAAAVSPEASGEPEQSAGLAPAVVEASPVVAEGRLLFDGQPISRLTSLHPTFWFRNETKGTPEKPQVEYKNGEFGIRGLPKGRMGMSMRVNLEPGNPNLYPGDLDGWTTFVVGEGPPPVLEVNLRKVMRLVQPVDNNAVIRGWDEPCGAGSVLPASVLFAWEPLDPAATYDVTVDRLACGRGYAPAGRAFKASTAETWVKIDLGPSVEGECYSFRLTARKGGRPLGMLTTHGRSSLGWDYRFTVK